MLLTRRKVRGVPGDRQLMRKRRTATGLWEGTRSDRPGGVQCSVQGMRRPMLLDRSGRASVAAFSSGTELRLRLRLSYRHPCLGSLRRFFGLRPTNRLRSRRPVSAAGTAVRSALVEDSTLRLPCVWSLRPASGRHHSSAASSLRASLRRDASMRPAFQTNAEHPARRLALWRPNTFLSLRKASAPSARPSPRYRLTCRSGPTPDARRSGSAASCRQERRASSPPGDNHAVTPVARLPIPPYRYRAP